MRGFNPRDRLFQPDLQREMEDCRGRQSRAGAGGAQVPTPLSIFGPLLEVWHRADSLSGSDLSGSDIVTWRDQSGKGRDLSQATPANRLSLSKGLINGKPAANPGMAGDDRFMSWTPWTVPSKCTIYAVVYFRSKVAAYQILLYTPGTSFTGPYLGGNPTQDRPMVFTNANTAEWGAALVDSTPYLIKFAWDDTTETCYTQVGNAPEVSQVSGISFAGGNFSTLGFDPAVVSSQDLFTPVGDLFVVSKRTTPAEDAAVAYYVRDYWRV